MKRTTTHAALAAAIVVLVALTSCPLDSPYRLAPEKLDMRLVGTWHTDDDDPNDLEDLKIEVRDAAAKTFTLTDLAFDWDYYDEYAYDDALEEYDGMPAETYEATLATVGKRTYIVALPEEPETYSDEFYYLAYEFSSAGLTLISTEDSFNYTLQAGIKSADDLKAFILKNQDNPKFFKSATSLWRKVK